MAKISDWLTVRKGVQSIATLHVNIKREYQQAVADALAAMMEQSPPKTSISELVALAIIAAGKQQKGE